MTCTAQAGLLVLRECGAPAAGACATCGRPLCAIHLGGGTCGGCMVASGGEASPEDSTRQSYYSEYGVVPGFGARTYFSEQDHQSLLQRAVPAAKAEEEYDAFDT